MVMARRPEVRTAPAPIAAVDAAGLAQQMGAALARVPFRRPWDGPAGLWHNLGQNVTREVVRTFMGYSSSLPIEEFRSIEAGLDVLARAALAPVVALEGVAQHGDVIGGVPVVRYLPGGIEPVGTILYLHGGGYVGTSPNMYAFFTARLAAVTQCEVVVADYRLAPEFPFPAGVTDATDVLGAMFASGVDPDRTFLAGDSGGGGLACSVVHNRRRHGLPHLAGLVLFSPEVDLRLDQPSVTDNADRDILPWNIPTAPYLRGESADDAEVSALTADVSGWPPVYLTWGGDEMFRDAIRDMSAHLVACDVETTGEEAEGMFHVYPILMPWADASREVFARVGDFVRTRVTELADLSAVSSARRR